MFSTETYINRRKKLLEQIGEGILFLPGNRQSSMNYEHNHYPFRQDSCFLYYSGIDLPDLAMVMDAASGEIILYGDEPTEDDLVWTGPVRGLTEIAAETGVTVTRASKYLSHDLQKFREQKQKIHFLPPYRSEIKLMLEAILDIPAGSSGLLSSEAFIKAVVHQRSYKTAEEIAEIEKAVDLTCELQLLAMKSARPGITESVLAGLLHGHLIGHYTQPAFPTILTTRGEILHNHYSDSAVQDGQLILCDCGAETVSHYAGDLTRTFPAGRSFTVQQKEIYQVVLDSLNHGVSLLKPGILFRDVHLRVCEKLVDGLKDLGLMKGSTADAVTAGAHTLFFPCGLGHMMGLDVHDMENLGEKFVGYTDKPEQSSAFGLKSLRLGRALEPGFVLTVEPGIYFNIFLMDRWQGEHKFYDFINYDQLQAYRSFGGVRIENDYLITDAGSQRLGQYIPTTIQEIEDFRKQPTG